MPVDLSRLVSAVKSFQQKGATFSGLKGKLGKSVIEEELKRALLSLTSDGKLKKFKSGRFEKYLDISFSTPVTGKTVEAVAAELEALIESSGTKLLSKGAMEKKVGVSGRRHIRDALSLLVSKAILIKLSFGRSKLYLHRDVAVEFWKEGISSPPPDIEPPKPSQSLTAAQVLPIYNRLKREQRGIDTVLISDLMLALKVSKEPLHQFILSEMKAGRAFIHPSTTVNIPNEAIDNGIHLEGDPDVQVTVVFREKK